MKSEMNLQSMQSTDLNSIKLAFCGNVSNDKLMHKQDASYGIPEDRYEILLGM